MLKSLSKLEDVLPRVFQTSIVRDVLDRYADAGVQRAGGEVRLTGEKFSSSQFVAVTRIVGVHTSVTNHVRTELSSKDIDLRTCSANDWVVSIEGPPILYVSSMIKSTSHGWEGM